jgi:hypothetical protein
VPRTNNSSAESGWCTLTNCSEPASPSVYRLIPKDPSIYIICMTQQGVARHYTITSSLPPPSIISHHVFSICTLAEALAFHNAAVGCKAPAGGSLVAALYHPTSYSLSLLFPTIPVHLNSLYRGAPSEYPHHGSAIVQNDDERHPFDHPSPHADPSQFVDMPFVACLPRSTGTCTPAYVLNAAHIAEGSSDPFHK